MYSDVIAYRKKEFAARMGVSVPTVDKWIARPDFPTMRVGRKILIPREQALEWVAAHIGLDTLIRDGDGE